MPKQQVENRLTTAEVAARLNDSNDTTLLLMKNTPGVLCLGAGSRTLYRIPELTVEALIARKSAQTRRTR